MALEAAEYRVRWKLSPDHALVAPAYSAQRLSAAAKELGSAAIRPRMRRHRRKRKSYSIKLISSLRPKSTTDVHQFV